MILGVSISTATVLFSQPAPWLSGLSHQASNLARAGFIATESGRCQCPRADLTIKRNGTEHLAESRPGMEEPRFMSASMSEMYSTGRHRSPNNEPMSVGFATAQHLLTFCRPHAMQHSNSIANRLKFQVEWILRIKLYTPTANRAWSNLDNR